MSRPDESSIVRASVWIEQEIAIATSIKFLDNRPMPVLVFIHESIAREGIRALLHLNPILFAEDEEVLAELPGFLELWKQSQAGKGISAELVVTRHEKADEHLKYRLSLYVTNNTSHRIPTYNFMLNIEAAKPTTQPLTRTNYKRFAL